MEAEEIRTRFMYYKAKDGQPEKYVAIRNMAKELALALDAACPESREKSLAITRLEECVMWANASIARRE